MRHTLPNLVTLGLSSYHRRHGLSHVCWHYMRHQIIKMGECNMKFLHSVDAHPFWNSVERWSPLMEIENDDGDCSDTDGHDHHRHEIYSCNEKGREEDQTRSSKCEIRLPKRSLLNHLTRPNQMCYNCLLYKHRITWIACYIRLSCLLNKDIVAYFPDRSHKNADRKGVEKFQYILI